MLFVIAGNDLNTLIENQRRLTEAGVSDSTRETRNSQLRRYKKFCRHMRLKPFPCSSFQARLYATKLSEKMKPVSIRNYLSAVWYFSKINGYPDFSSDFLFKQLLNGIERTFDNSNYHSRYPLSALELLAMYKFLDMRSAEDRIFWIAVTICFRGLLASPTLHNLPTC